MILLWPGKYILELPGIQSSHTYSTLKWFHDTLDKQILVTLSWHVSLIPLFSFWLLAVCKKGGGKPGPFYHVNDVSVYRGGEVPNQKKKKTTTFCACVLCFRPGTVCFCFVNVWNSSTWSVSTRKGPKLVLLMGDPSPFCLPTDIMHRIKWIRRSHSIFQKWTVGRSVNEATLYPSYYLKLYTTQ